MQLKSCLAIALVAGTFVSVASAQDVAPVRSVSRAHLSGTTGPLNGRKVVRHETSGASDAVPVYDSGNLAIYLQNAAGAFGDHHSFTTGPGMGGPVALTSLDYFTLGCSSTAGWPGGDVDMLIEFWNNYSESSSPVNSGLLYQLRVPLATLPALTAGQFYFVGPVDLTALNMTLPDDEFFTVQYVIPRAAVAPITQ